MVGVKYKATRYKPTSAKEYNMNSSPMQSKQNCSSNTFFDFFGSSNEKSQIHFQKEPVKMITSVFESDDDGSSYTPPVKPFSLETPSLSPVKSRISKRVGHRSSSRDSAISQSKKSYKLNFNFKMIDHKKKPTTGNITVTRIIFSKREEGESVLASRQSRRGNADDVPNHRSNITTPSLKSFYITNPIASDDKPVPQFGEVEIAESEKEENGGDSLLATEEDCEDIFMWKFL